MKHGTRPTRRQKDYISRHGYLEDSWLVIEDTAERMVLQHRTVGKEVKRMVVIDKEVQKCL